MQAHDRGCQTGHVSTIFNHIIGKPAPVIAICLAGKNGPHLGFIQAWPQGCALYLQLFVAIDDRDSIQPGPIGLAMLSQQGHDHDDVGASGLFT